MDVDADVAVDLDGALDVIPTVVVNLCVAAQRVVNDFKYWDPSTCARLLKAKDYPERARAAVREMHRQVGDLEVGPDRLARRGLLVRHLVMPDGLGDSAEIFAWLAGEVGGDTYVNIMDQYHPDGLVARQPERYPQLARPLRAGEHERALELARAAGLHRIDRRDAHPLLRQRMRRSLPLL